MRLPVGDGVDNELERSEPAEPVELVSVLNWRPG